jgi:hypothetical protein
MNKITKLAGAMILAVSLNAGHAAISITGTAANSYNFALSSGAVLTDGGLFQIGFYSTAPSSSYFQGLTSASQFETNWTSLASSTANYSDYAGLRSATADLANGVTAYTGKTLVMLVGNASTIASSTQFGVFSNAAWVIPSNPTGDVPDAFGVDIQDTGTVAYFGSLSLGTGAYPSDLVVNSANLASIAVIPEPSVASLLALGTVGLVALRVRRKS